MKMLLMGLFILPALIGSLVFFHTLIDTKSHDGKEITNRIARIELFWLAISRPGMFCEEMPWVCSDVKRPHEDD